MNQVFQHQSMLPQVLTQKYTSENVWIAWSQAVQQVAFSPCSSRVPVQSRSWVTVNVKFLYVFSVWVSSGFCCSHSPPKKHASRWIVAFAMIRISGCWISDEPVDMQIWNDWYLHRLMNSPVINTQQDKPHPLPPSNINNISSHNEWDLGMSNLAQKCITPLMKRIRDNRTTDQT